MALWKWSRQQISKLPCLCNISQFSLGAGSSVFIWYRPSISYAWSKSSIIRSRILLRFCLLPLNSIRLPVTLERRHVFTVVGVLLNGLSRCEGKLQENLTYSSNTCGATCFKPNKWSGSPTVPCLSNYSKVCHYGPCEPAVCHDWYLPHQQEGAMFEAFPT